LATSPKDTSEPREFEGDEIVGSTIKLVGAGDGLSDSLKIEPVAFHRGEDVFFVVHGKNRFAAFPPEKKGSDRVVRQHTIDTVDIAIVDEADVAELLLRNRQKVKDAMEALAAQMRTDDPEDHPFSPDEENDKVCFECGQTKGARWHKAAS
jgi:hypothetical protein